ncbi:helix-turn-helix domain-containing protein [Methylobrevis albus]|uniref:Helix-turn-helix transcriptional regulator n=1 Tax=Methylobrevis albus TaxID=2793297 RepID=A0A931MWV5_9HYPH|nr:AraC family transcriptional regulator [Methylobrevis albus]MBH0237923.1 helix-turn-helix transcriptional regulator [Methylobrevis albus]
MLTLPVPLVVSLVLIFLMLRVLVRRDRPPLFAAFVGACALQGLVVSLNQHYGLTGLHPLQPVTATMIPPLAWITFETSVRRRLELRLDLPHLAGPAFTAFASAFAPSTLDVVVPAIFLIYGGLILVALRSGDDGLPHARLEAGGRPRLIWLAIALGLIFSAAVDGVIALGQAAGHDELRALAVGFAASLNLLVIGLLGLSPDVAGAAPDDAETMGEARAGEAPAGEAAAGTPDAGLAARDAGVMARVADVLDRQGLALDPDLTLARLARRAGLPAKEVSAAINRTTGENVSRYVNGHRIRQACVRLCAGASVTTAMLESGFNSKSNFNREFLRVTGLTPSAFVADAGKST